MSASELLLEVEKKKQEMLLSRVEEEGEEGEHGKKRYGSKPVVKRNGKGRMVRLFPRVDDEVGNKNVLREYLKRATYHGRFKSVKSYAEHLIRAEEERRETTTRTPATTSTSTGLASNRTLGLSQVSDLVPSVWMRSNSSNVVVVL